MMRVLGHWNKQPGEAVDDSSLEVVKVRVGDTLKNLV